jgi:4-amino-4-deoxy-L-arabinose transferase-like glycosyltransferase
MDGMSVAVSESPTLQALHPPAWLGRWAVPILILLCLLAWLPGIVSLPALDRDESRFAQASKQMIETGDYVDIRFSAVPRYNKPVGIYWAQAVATRFAGHPPYNHIWTYRLPSLLGGVLAVLLTYWCARAFASREIALLAAALLALTVAVTAEAEIATTDALLLASIVAVQGFLLRLYLRARGRLEADPSLGMALAAWAAIGVGILLKGPVILAVVGLTVLALSLWDRDWRWLRGLRTGPGLLVTLAIVLPWAIAIALASHGAFYQRSLGHDFAAKILAGQESHGAPPGYYLVLASVTLWPASLFALPGIGKAIAERTKPVLRFLLAWIVPNWLMFELVPTKLPHYILPVYPALTLIAAVWSTAPRQADTAATNRILRIAAAMLFMLVGLAFAAAAILLPGRFGHGIGGPLAYGAAVIGVLVAIAALLQLLRRESAAALCALAAALLLYPLAAAGVAPSLEQLWMSPAIADRVTRDGIRTDPPIVLAGYVEPSAVFLLGTSTRLEGGKGAGKLAATQGGLALVEDHERVRFLDALHATGGRERVVDQVSGFDYSRGRREHVTFYRVTPALAVTMPPSE